MAAFKIHVFLDVTLCRLVINYRRFEHSHVVQERLGLLELEEVGTAMFRKEEAIYQSTECHIPEDVYWTATSVRRNCRHADVTRVVAKIRPSFTPRRRWPQHVHNTLSFFFYFEWIPFCRQKAVLWIPATRPGSNFANNYRVVRLFAPVPRLKDMVELRAWYTFGKPCDWSIQCACVVTHRCFVWSLFCLRNFPAML